MDPRLRCHIEKDPVCPQNAKRPGPHTIPCQFNKPAVPVKDVVGLTQVKGDGSLSEIHADRHGTEWKRIFLAIDDAMYRLT